MKKRLINCNALLWILKVSVHNFRLMGDHILHLNVTLCA